MAVHCSAAASGLAVGGKQEEVNDYSVPGVLYLQTENLADSIWARVARQSCRVGADQGQTTR